jgi:rhodanese-related sulfurtransferase
MNEVPQDKNIVLVCNSGMRSYEAQLNLREMGITNTRSVEGGMKMLKAWGSDV